MLVRVAQKYPDKRSSYLNGYNYLERKMYDELLYAILRTINIYQPEHKTLSEYIIYTSFINDPLLYCWHKSL